MFYLELSAFNVETEEVDCCGSDGQEKGVEGEALEKETVRWEGGEWRVRIGG